MVFACDCRDCADGGCATNCLRRGHSALSGTGRRDHRGGDRGLHVAEGQLIRFGYGLYAKADRSPYSGKTVPQKPLPALAEEALSKLGVKIVESTAKALYNSGKSTQVPTGRVIGVKGRISRKMGYNGQSVKLEHVV